jgi:TolB-like protein
MKRIFGALILFLVFSSICHAQSYWTGDGGKGIVIAVPPPAMQNATAANNWIPQLFQDLITSDMAKFSAMTVLDRKNESLTLAEQQLSANGNYSDENYIRMGQLTNAKYIVAGSINNISGRYHVNFRINNAETNEIRTSFNKQYGFEQIENGQAAKETTFELLKGMGITLTPEGERQLLALQNTQIRSTAQLARGMAAKKDDNIVDALSYLYQASEAGSNKQEALSQINGLSFTVSTGSVRERANAGIALQEKWRKIIADLKTYMLENSALCLVYDFSKIEDSINYNLKRVSFTITPGVQVVANRTVILVWQKLFDEFMAAYNTHKDGAMKEFTGGKAFPALPRNHYQYLYLIKFGFYDEFGDRIAETFINFELTLTNYGDAYRYSDQAYKPQALSQVKYCSPDNYVRLRSGSIPLDRITDSLVPRIESVSVRDGMHAKEKPINIPWYTPSEWQEWLAGQSR